MKKIVRFIYVWFVQGCLIFLIKTGLYSGTKQSLLNGP